MWNTITLEEMEELNLPSNATVGRQNKNQRQLYLHLFNDEYEYFIAGYDPQSREVFCYSITRDVKFVPMGSWRRISYEYLLSVKSDTGAELTDNLNFRQCRARDVPQIMFCEEEWEKLRDASYD